MALVKVPEKQAKRMLFEFVNNQDMAFEGIDLKNISKIQLHKNLKDWEEKFRKAGYDQKHFMVYYTTGKVMNDVFNWTGDNAYPDDFTVLIIPDFHNPAVKYEYNKQVGNLHFCRWFSDIFFSNCIKQSAEYDLELLESAGLDGKYEVEPDFD